MKPRAPLALLAFWLAAELGCASTSPATSWGWSSWYRRSGTGSASGFRSQRATCLSQMGVTDPERVEPRSSQDVGFVQCMNAAGWCNQVWECRAPTVRSEER
jgi:hypothetical protein